MGEITAEDIIGMKKIDLVEFAAEHEIEVSTSAKVDVIKEEILKALGLEVEVEVEPKKKIIKPVVEVIATRRFKNAAEKENMLIHRALKAAKKK